MKSNFLSSVSANPWTKDQTNFLRSRCAEWIRNKKILNKSDAIMIKEEMPLLFKNRSWSAIKNKICKIKGKLVLKVMRNWNVTIIRIFVKYEKAIISMF